MRACNLDLNFFFPYFVIRRCRKLFIFLLFIFFFLQLRTVPGPQLEFNLKIYRGKSTS